MTASDKIDLPLATWALWTGILSIALTFLESLVPLAIGFAVLGIITGTMSRNRYKKNPEKYKVTSARNATIGWICAIAGLCVSIAWGMWYLMDNLV